MGKSKQRIYCNRYTGELKYLTKSQAKHLSEDWSRTEQIVNDEGERGMRLHLNGATVDILEHKPQEVAANGNTDTK